mmetsp:Transcript_62018/g.183182  ORF Transcript_62018/g.183182 Transcript_62018/m.183182 type:complete len:252 (-) Transcript_62018:574-1329(-)
MEEGKDYTGEQAGKNVGRRPKIEDGFVDQQIIADWLNQGLGLRLTQLMVNTHRAEQGEELVTLSAVHSCALWMRPKHTKIKKRAQVGKNYSKWAHSLKYQTKQFLIRFGYYPKLLPRPIPKKYDIDLLGKLHITQVAWWDEMHRECQIGKVSSHQNIQVQFPRDANVKYDLNGEYDMEVTILNVKYSAQVRISIGVAQISIPFYKDEGRIIQYERRGIRCSPFNYSTKSMISRKDARNHISAEMRRVHKRR